VKPKIGEVTVSDANRDPKEEIPKIQKLFDRPFLWLTLGFVTMVVFYTLWGIWEMSILPQAPLP